MIHLRIQDGGAIHSRLLIELEERSWIQPAFLQAKSFFPTHNALEYPTLQFQCFTRLQVLGMGVSSDCALGPRGRK